MADKSINQLPVSAGLTDDGLLVVYQNNITQSIRGNLIREFAQQGVESAMAAAKESGEFDGEDGQDGYTPVKGKDYFDGEDGEDGVSPTITVEAITGGHKLTITDKNGTQTVNVMDGEDGEDGMGSGDMLAADYDPQRKKQDIFAYVDNAVSNIPAPDVSGQISEHNTNTSAHEDIRSAVSQALNDAKKYTDEQLDAIPTPDVSGQIETHNTSATAHSDIRAELANKAPAYTYGTEDLTAGVSPLATGTLYFVYE